MTKDYALGLLIGAIESAAAGGMDSSDYCTRMYTMNRLLELVKEVKEELEDE